MCSVCIQELTRNAYDNLNYRSEKHLKRLQNDSTVDLISFTMVVRESGTISLWPVYSSNITVCEARGRRGKYQDIALLLGSIIAENQGTTDWPPAANEMQLRSGEFLLQYFSRFLNLVTAMKEDVGSSLVFSIEQNLCRAVSEAAWKLPI